jgi:hypothetical protein
MSIKKELSHSIPKNFEKGESVGKVVPHPSQRISPLKIKHKLRKVFPYGKVYVPVIPKKKDGKKKC